VFLKGHGQKNGLEEEGNKMNFCVLVLKNKEQNKAMAI